MKCEREWWRYLEGEHFRAREQQVLRCCGGSVPACLRNSEELEGSQ